MVAIILFAIFFAHYGERTFKTLTKRGRENCVSAPRVKLCKVASTAPVS